MTVFVLGVDEDEACIGAMALREGGSMGQSSRRLQKGSERDRADTRWKKLPQIPRL
jgi:hypothetical protein